MGWKEWMRSVLANGFSANNLLVVRQEIIMISQKNQTKISNFTVDRDHNYKKVRKQGWSPIPADILVGI